MRWLAKVVFRTVRWYIDRVVVCWRAEVRRLRRRRNWLFWLLAFFLLPY